MSTTAASDDIGFFLEVNLKYPLYLHKWHNYYPLVAEKVKITHDMLSLSLSLSLFSITNKHFDRKKVHKI